ncbi:MULTISPECIES: bifunctional methylenetetrahydrofolate dehydrogenase/methenyltetrahydrofolate cyclohydrolase FolD [unclassified Exiguobacterium]|uniref:bifunctional methylenetetrahydrofolate dehydrogenase/methenyltetrahydrofolate cyclohydrolase FolD n=1 Tax=unclassified Exiguobacterium TaxID=2644629 RepID=UPI00103DB67D|nr:MULTISPECIES: bifunctional methylenetetrahydrofolate dehydrogenase/methenyltetrahydrofolate cyclohydrolase FolD [unclassified Exiguobacterium]TCI47662.1 bifunctional methylenetetrahydrofolate dehydrogenase/methenyltetrahydrofolate cyclohydrolase FolD [Exiguobacterium sp. SH5S32]TCI54548.1 bifunctional methylenetetrahydrofolate dehydrogenase/methenyltetrahydrofolate cyclohydrolase FolD [Exiguobacterium sp. SH1S4]TCI74342.1 bifunctional methylenetetrahydrofolate dehydrogenase/methenyltetrahydro
MAVVIDGKQIAASYRETLKDQVTALRARGITPKLKVILIGDDPASHSYVRGKERAAKEIGIDSQILRFDEDMTEAELLKLIDLLNDDHEVHGILVQLPLPNHIDESRVIMRISPEKDVDGFHPENVGKMMLGLDTLLPCTPHGILHLVKTQTDLVGKHVVVVGRSQIVGKPVGMLFLNESSTVTYCHSKTADLGAMTRQADILIVAVGRAGLVTADMVKPGAIVIDVGVNRVDNRLVGDVDYEGVKDVASAITPVPGGVGPMTITMLMHNTVEVASRG